MDTVRAFVGCLLDIAATRKVADLTRAVRKGAETAGWKAVWVPPPNLHVTLRFLGDVDAGLVAPLSDALAVVARGAQPLRLTVAGIGAFPREDDPKVVFAEVFRGHEDLTALARAVDDACYELGFPRETRGFHPHVTLGRVREATGPLRAITPALTDCGPAVITEVVLYRSDLLRQGAEYHPLARYTLGAEPNAGPREQGQSSGQGHGGVRHGQ